MIDDDDDVLLPFLLDLKVFFPLLQPQCLPLFRCGLVAVVVQQKGPHLPTDGNINPTKENGLEEGAKVMAGTVLAFPETATSNCPLLCFGACSSFLTSDALIQAPAICTCLEGKCWPSIPRPDTNQAHFNVNNHPRRGSMINVSFSCHGLIPNPGDCTALQTSVSVLPSAL